MLVQRIQRRLSSLPDRRLILNHSKAAMGLTSVLDRIWWTRSEARGILIKTYTRKTWATRSIHNVTHTILRWSMEPGELPASSVWSMLQMLEDITYLLWGQNHMTQNWRRETKDIGLVHSLSTSSILWAWGITTQHTVRAAISKCQLLKEQMQLFSLVETLSRISVWTTQSKMPLGWIKTT